MAAGLESVDSWLYGEEASKSPAAPETEHQQPTSENERPSTPTLDDMEAESSTLGAPLPTPTNKIVSTAPDLQPKVTTPTEDAQGVDEGEDEEEEEEEEESDSDDDDVQIHIGEIKTTTPVYARTPSYTRVTIPPGAAGGVLSQGKKVDLDTLPQIRGQSIFEFSLEATADKPWRMPGADITDFFNYGFMEETWKLYCDKQRRMRSEVVQLNKIAVHNTRGITIPTDTSTRAIPALGAPLVFPATHGLLPPVSVMTTPTSTFATSSFPGAIASTATGETREKTPERNVGEQGGDGASDGRATPGVDTTEMSFDPATAMSKTGLLPPPPVSLPPPPLPFPPPPLHGVSSQDNIAAAMAAMLGGMRPPDHLPGMPPPPIGLNLPPGMPPPFPPHLHGHEGVLPPPFPGLPPPFHLPGGEHGPPPLDERGLPIPPEMLGGPGGGAFPWDPSLGPPPPEMFDGFASRDYRHSRTRSRSSSLSRSRSRSSSDDRERKPRRRERERRHRRHSRSRSRSRDRDRERTERSDRSDRHRTSRHRREHHRDRHDRERDRDRDRDKNRERERDRDRDRDRDREKDRDKEKERNSRRREKEERSRHERSHRHRSSSRDRKEEDRSSRKERREHREPREAREAREPQQPEVRESRSKSRTPN